jgi:NhaA family Na+:H+ antiporter
VFLEALVAIFFIYIGIEIRSTLNHLKDVALPAIAALGGMAVPALLFLLLAQDTQAWAATMPTDIALALAVVALLGKNFSPAVRIFLLTLAVADDLFSLIALGIFYSDKLDLLHAAATLGSAALGIALASIPKFPAHRTLRALAPIITFAVIPIYVIAKLSEGISVEALTSQTTWTFIFARIVGKVVGITLFAYIASSLRIPLSIEIKHVAGIGLLSGIGMTVSLVIADVALTSEVAFSEVRAGLIAGALISALMSVLWFKRFPAV